MIFVTEDERKRYIENKVFDFIFHKPQQKHWLDLEESSVIKALKLWVKMNNLANDVTIWVDPLSEFRYRLIPNWNHSVWVRDNINIYNYPLDEV